jgi:hypothetical protein
MGRYIQWGLEQAGHKVVSIGPFSHGTIPWNNIQYPKRYWFAPTVEVPDIASFPAEDVFILMKSKGIKIDLLIQASDTTFLSGKVPVKNIVIGTDPHVINYEPFCENADGYFSMQKTYSKPSDGWMPYGYDEETHFYLPDTPIEWDVVFCGLQYDHRKDALRSIQDAGYRVFSGLGYVYDEYVYLYNTGIIAFNWSSKLDLPARFWEGLAMRRLVLTNRVPELKEFPDLKEDVDYLAFETIEEAVNTVKLIMNKPDLIDNIATHGYKQVRPHSYKNRAIKLLEDIERC